MDGIDVLSHSQKIRKYATTIEAWKEDTLVGLCTCYLNNVVSGIAYVTHIQVHSGYRRMGVGQELMNATISLAKEKRFSILQLEVNVDNTIAIAFYKTNGFLIKENHTSKYLLELFINS